MADGDTLLRCQLLAADAFKVSAEGDTILLRFAVGDTALSQTLADELNRQLAQGCLRLEVVKSLATEQADG